MTAIASVVVAGAGHAGVQLAASLRDGGFAGAITLVCDDPHLPYQRPILSKSFLKADGASDPPPLRAASYYVDKGIDLRLNERVAAIDRAGCRVELGSGGAIPYGHLVIATGCRERRLLVPGAELPGVFRLRSLADAAALRPRLQAAHRLVVIGAGFIGLEVAATATQLGLQVDIVDLNERPLSRSVSEGTGAFLARAHAGFGARLHMRMGVAKFTGDQRGVTGAVLTDGRHLQADIVLVGIGVTPDDTLAQLSGLDHRGGILVGRHLGTSDPAISAIGDCAVFAHPDACGPSSLQSIQNATDQARSLARRLLGQGEAYDAVPWFWSDQRDLKLQIVGTGTPAAQWKVLEDAATRSMVSLGFVDGLLSVVETVNRPREHLLARKLLKETAKVSQSDLAALGYDLMRV